MANAHVAHNCHVHNDVILVNGVLLGGHVHVDNGAIISGNSVVHHYSTIGTLAFVSGGCRVPHDIPPYMLAAGSDNPSLKTINRIGMQRAGMSREIMSMIQKAFRMHFRELKTIEDVQQHFDSLLDGQPPQELTNWLAFITRQINGHNLRARDPAGESAADERLVEDSQNTPSPPLPIRHAA